MLSSPSNDYHDGQRYEVTVFTGMRRDAGTTAKPALILTGDNGDSRPVLLYSEARPIFRRNYVDSFLVTTAEALGNLLYLRLWHDNAGSNPAWYIRTIIVRDVETDQVG